MRRIKRGKHQKYKQALIFESLGGDFIGDLQFSEVIDLYFISSINACTGNEQG